MIREGLAGKRVVLSGVTGFLGTALLERLLTDTDVARIDAIARGDAHARVAGLLTGACFGPARDHIGGERLWEMFQQKVRPIHADLMEAAPPLLAALVRACTSCSVSRSRPTKSPTGARSWWRAGRC